MMKQASRFTTLLMAVLLLGTAVSAQDPPKEKSLDDALLEGLDNELLEGAGDLKKPPRDAQDPAAPRDVEAAIAGEEVGMPNPEEDPLGYISQEMRRVEQQLPELSRRPHTQELQRRIVDNLAQLIEQAEKQQSQQSSSQSKSQQSTSQRQSPTQSQQPITSGPSQDSKQPASDSSERLGSGEAVRPDPELLRGLMKDAWGHLPERDREQMRQMAPERFVPQYELLIERYYRRLAEERTR